MSNSPVSDLWAIAVERIYRPRRPEQNTAYLKFVRLWPCLVCFSKKGVEAAHMGPHGIGQKSCDYSAIPLCRKHHRTADDSYHALGPARFATHHKLNVEAFTKYLRTQYERLTSGGKTQ